ncbi:hypothetical protein FE257_003791 [Aspergillus nanangensis]|uniref:Uncharacterized protein n=1 Tax=Aspergillus nanangensis TaxID=2582783 RepID=A0AAD4GNE6_ASPNN|nr:hypothetical protein FE257_003791 [Aspergillus nanangensis]
MKRSIGQSNVGEPTNADELLRENCEELKAKFYSLREVVKEVPSRYLDLIIKIVLDRGEHLEFLQRVEDGHELQIAQNRTFSGLRLYQALLIQAHKHGGSRLGKLVILTTTPNKLYFLRGYRDIILEHLKNIGETVRPICAPTPQTFFDQLSRKNNKRWASNGQIFKESIHDIGLSEEALRWVKEKVDNDSQPQDLEGIGNLDLLRLLCWMVPQEISWEPKALIRDLGPLVVRTAHRCQLSDLRDRDKHVAIETLVAITKANSLDTEPLDIATRMLNHSVLPRYLHGLVSLQWSTLYRLQTQPQKSEDVISEYYRDTEIDELAKRAKIAEDLPNAPEGEIDRLCRTGREKRQAAVEAGLKRSHLENLVQQEEYWRAFREATAWLLFVPSCEMEDLLAPSISITLAKIFQTLGEFFHARNCLEVTPLRGEQRFNILCRRADALCELGDPAGASRLLQGEVQTHARQWQPYRKIKRLLLSLVDAYLAEGCYDKALPILCDSRLDFAKTDKDITDQFLHVRCQFARARIYFYTHRFEDGLREWHAALALIHMYPDFKDNGFAAGICHLSMAWAHVELKDHDSGQAAYEESTWTYSTRKEESNDREDLLPKLLQNEWKATQASNGIQKAFPFANVADAVVPFICHCVVAKAEPGSICFHSKSKCVELIGITGNMATWLGFVKESVIEVEVEVEEFIEGFSAIEGLQTVFRFASVDAALNFHTLVHRCFLCKKLPIESLYEDQSVTVISQREEGMKMCGPIVDALSGNLEACRSLGEDGIPTILHFAHHSKVAIFVRAVVIASRSAGSLSVTSGWTEVKLNGMSKMDGDWLRFVLQNVVKPDPEDRVEKCGSAL